MSHKHKTATEQLSVKTEYIHNVQFSSIIVKVKYINNDS